MWLLWDDDDWWAWNYTPFKTKFVFSDQPGLDEIWQEFPRKEAPMDVQAKFFITSCEAQRETEYAYDEQNHLLRNEDNSPKKKDPVLVTHVKLSAVQGHPFGKYTPSGNIDMFIKDSPASVVFQDAWDAHVRDTNPEAKPPEFFVTFQIDDGTACEG